jgi:elongation factor Ts
MSSIVQISAAMVKELREISQAGMMECKKALSQSNGDIELALENLKAAGIAKAAKRSSCIAAEGLIVALSSADNREAILLEVNCETDFVAREQSFKDFCIDIAKVALATKTFDIAAIAQQSLNDLTIEANRLELVLKLGENISLRRIQHVVAPAGAVVGAYLHGGSDAARIGALVCLQGTSDAALAKDVAMQVAAMNPEYLSDIPADRLEKEQATLVDHADGAERLQEFVNTVVLHNQTFFKNPNFTMKELLANNFCTVAEFMRYEVGDGIEKKQNDFASEVMAQAGLK